MSVVGSLETKAVGWYKSVPHLPVNAQKWLAENVWWLAIISVVASVIGIFGTIAAISTYLSLMGALVAYYPGQQVYGTAWIVASLVSLAFTLAITIITALAVGPLRTLRKKGWNLLFITLLLSTASVVLGAILSFNVGSFIGGMLFGALLVGVSGYFLFEVRSYFVINGARRQTPEYKPPTVAK